jgi:hypothetical protein
MIRAAWLLALLLALPLRVEAAWATVGTNIASTTNIDDPVMTFPDGAIGNGNVVIIVASVEDTAVTVSIESSSFAISALSGFPKDASTNRRMYVFCGIGDGTDAQFTVTTSTTASVIARGIEFSGGTCTLDGTAQSTALTNQTTHALTTDVTVTASDSLLIGAVRSTTAANFDPVGSLTQFGTDGTVLSAGYQILVASGDFDPQWTSAATETTIIVGVALQAAGGGGGGGTAKSLLLMGVGDGV